MNNLKVAFLVFKSKIVSFGKDRVRLTKETCSSSLYLYWVLLQDVHHLMNKFLVPSTRTSVPLVCCSFFVIFTPFASFATKLLFLASAVVLCFVILYCDFFLTITYNRSLHTYVHLYTFLGTFVLFVFAILFFFFMMQDWFNSLNQKFGNFLSSLQTYVLLVSLLFVKK
jgi:hypothetical protein